jgi:hypothetical protein
LVEDSASVLGAYFIAVHSQKERCKEERRGQQVLVATQGILKTDGNNQLTGGAGKKVLCAMGSTLPPHIHPECIMVLILPRSLPKIRVT